MMRVSMMRYGWNYNSFSSWQRLGVITSTSNRARGSTREGGREGGGTYLHGRIASSL